MVSMFSCSRLLRGLLMGLLLLVGVGGAVAGEPKEVGIPSGDGLTISADVYMDNGDSATLILLCHRAAWSRGEYREIAPRLCEMGFNCVAIDQRSGKEVNGVENKTATQANRARKGTSYLDAGRDIEAAAKWCRANGARGKLVIWGSSYSSALALRLTATTKGLADGVVAFSPGEYFSGTVGQSDTYVEEGMKELNVPVFITSARNEKERWAGIFRAIPTESKVSFVPDGAGAHGCEALWKKTPGNPEYWEAVKGFLNKYFPRGEGKKG